MESLIERISILNRSINNVGGEVVDLTGSKLVIKSELLTLSERLKIYDFIIDMVKEKEKERTEPLIKERNELMLELKKGITNV